MLKLFPPPLLSRLPVHCSQALLRLDLLDLARLHQTNNTYPESLRSRGPS